MTSSEMVSGHKLNFSQTCNRLSQYLREKGSFGELNLGLSANFHQHGPGGSSSSSSSPTTMDLLPMIDRSGQDTGCPTRPERAQMTIFYGGQVLVFNDFPADEAKKIMDMAATTKPPVAAATSNKVVSESEPNVRSWNNNPPTQPLASNGLPIMRNASLGRFLAKRKDRITARAPYQVNNMVGGTGGTGGATPKGEEEDDDKKMWLGLGAQPPQQQQQKQKQKQKQKQLQL